MATRITAAAIFLASAVLSIVFLLRHRADPRRWLPCLTLIALPFLELIPESGWSDVRSQWHRALGALAWSVWTLFLVAAIMRRSEGRVCVCLRATLGVVGGICLGSSALSLIESWVFFHPA